MEAVAAGSVVPANRRRPPMEEDRLVFETSKGVEPISSFAEMGIKDDLLRGIYQYGFEKPSAIQQRAVLPIISGRDVIAQAQSGTGKTSMIALTVCQVVDTKNSEVQALILSPTRELAAQTEKVILAIGDYINIQAHACIGGKSVGEDIRKLEHGVQVVSGTPGRVCDMIKRRTLRTRAIKLLILDESDEMLSRGFKDQIYDVYRYLPPELQVVLISARTQAICELRLISKNDSESRPLIADAGAVPYLSESLYSSNKLSQENATATLHNLSISNKDLLMSTRGLLDALSHALRNPSSPFVAQCAAATIFSLLTVESYRSIIGHKRDILFGLIDIIKNPNSDSRTLKDALKALFGIALYPLNRVHIIELGAVPPLFSLLCNDSRAGILEDVTAVIAQIAGCEESWEAFRKISGVGVLVDMLDSSTGSSRRTKENAVSALLNLVQCGGEETLNSIRGIVLGAVDGIIEVAENGTDKGRNKAMALLKILDASSCTFQEEHVDYLSNQSS